MVLSVLHVITDLIGMDLAVLYAIMGKYGAQLKVFANALLVNNGMEQHALLFAVKEWSTLTEFVHAKLDSMISTVYAQENHHALQVKPGMDFDAHKSHAPLELFGMELSAQHHRM
jgi:hypothetical protein